MPPSFLNRATRVGPPSPIVIEKLVPRSEEPGSPSSSRSSVRFSALSEERLMAAVRLAKRDLRRRRQEALRSSFAAAAGPPPEESSHDTSSSVDLDWAQVGSTDHGPFFTSLFESFSSYLKCHCCYIIKMSSCHSILIECQLSIIQE